MASVYNNNVYGLTGYYSNGGWPSTFFIACLNSGFLLTSKIYNTAIFGNDSRAINNTIDGGFIMTGGISITSSSSDIYLIRTNTYGDTLWTRHFDKSQADALCKIRLNRKLHHNRRLFKCRNSIVANS
jgi:hypothetical protein